SLKTCLQLPIGNYRRYPGHNSCDRRPPGRPYSRICCYSADAQELPAFHPTWPFPESIHLKYEHSTVEILSDIVKVEPHEATLSEVVRFLNGGWHLQRKSERRAGTGGQCQSKGLGLCQSGKMRIDIK